MTFLKKFLIFALCAVLVTGAVLSASAAGSYFYSEGYSYGIDQNEACVHSYMGSEQDVVIREKFLSYYVTSVEEFAFFRNDTVHTLSFYDATRLVSLGQCAFAECVNLQYVEIPSSIQQMGNSVFDSCTSLSSVRFRTGAVSSIPAQAFSGCSSLETVVFENDVTSIGNLAFADCASLKEIELPDSVVSIAANAFNRCEGLVIRCSSGSYAMQYAISNSIDYFLTDASPYLLGDANRDGNVNINDVTTIQRHIAQLMSLDKIHQLASDVNRNGELNITDATILQMYLAQYKVNYPIGQFV